MVINSGSSSLKYQLICSETQARLASGLIERIGSTAANISHTGNPAHDTQCEPFKYEASELNLPDHTAAFDAMAAAFEAAGTPLAGLDLLAVGHRVVQGGERFVQPTLIDDEVIAGIAELSDLAPLHNPGQHAGIIAARRVFPAVPHVAVFDTAFHRTIPAKAHKYAIDAETAAKYRVRRYGFHGSSHQFVSRRGAEILGKPLAETKQIVLHLGNGGSVCAVDGGRSINTSMGLSPLPGLVMGTRCGDIDPSVIFHLHRVGGLSIDEIDSLLNKKSGLLGLTGSNDVRDVTAWAEEGRADATEALEIYAHRIRHYIGAYMLELGGLDSLIFTAGVGENSAVVRSLVCRDLAAFGIVLDETENAVRRPGERVISAPESRVKVLIVPTDEELEIALQAKSLLA